MKRRRLNVILGKWLPLALVVAAGVALTLHASYLPLGAQEQGGTPQQAPATPGVTPPAESPPAGQAPAAKPEEPKPAQQPAVEKKEEKPEAKEKAPEKAEKAEVEQLENQSCLDCHNPDILKMSKEELAEQVVVPDKPEPARKKPPYVFGDLTLAIKDDAYKAGVHAETTCVTCHKDVVELPHAQRLKQVDCRECHEESAETVQASAHGEKLGPKAPGCIGCHDSHYGKPVADYAKDFRRKVCVDCHKAYGSDSLKEHPKLYEAGLHLKTLDCMNCHQGTEKGVHNILSVKTRVAGCESCHTKYSALTKEKKVEMSLGAYVMRTSFLNNDALKKYGYVLGANRIPAFDAIIILVVLGPLGLPIVHGGLRILTRRKGPIELPEEKILLHPLPERIWHWFQALCIVMLVITGIMLHWPEKFPGWFSWSVTVHNWFGIGAVIAFLFWLIYNLSTRRIRHYIPRKGEIPRGLITQAKFYGYGIFKHEPHPYAPSEDNKFNPLQKIAYLKFQLLLFPLLLISGLLYMYPQACSGVINAIGGMTVLAIVHYILGALFAAFLVAHLYLATTGETIGENFKAIIFGYGIKEDHGKHH
ncbi:MAG: cytochrome b/b6 domain-containing protein [Desulfomonile tiedjei]|nr:cytochrome b/b6 domain-containing protein [Desulfomonile tiedjei]